MHGNDETEGKGIVTVLLTSGFLVLIGFAALGALMYFSWQLGWSLGHTDMDRYALGSLHVVAELASAGLVGWAAVIAALGGKDWRRRSFIAFMCAVGFACVSVLNTYGFMSPRVAEVAGHSAVLDTQKGYAEWLKQQTVNPDVANAYAAAAAECATGRGPKCLAAEARAEYLARQQGNMGTQLRRQFKELEKTASSTPDAHALAIAGITGLSVAAATKLIVIIMSGFGQCVKFTCTFFGFKGVAEFFRRRRRRISGSPKSDSGDGGSGDKIPEIQPEIEHANVHRLPAKSAEPSRLQATDTVRSVPSDAPEPPISVPEKSSRREKREFRQWFALQPVGASWNSVEALAHDSGVSNATVSRVTRDLDGTKLERSRVGRSVRITKTGGRRPVWKSNGGAIHAFG